MGGDCLHDKRKRERELRKSKVLKERAETWLLVCEGGKTEPNYFESLFKYANSLSDKKIKYKIFGTGKNTQSLINSVEDFFSCTTQLKNDVLIPYGKIFVVFDKDSFKKEQFNNAIDFAINKEYIPIWSNECFELWYLLHFILLKSNIPRNQYFSKLEEFLKRDYQKNDDHFQLLNSEKNLRIAIKNSKKLFEEFESEKSYAKKAPCTNVHDLIEEIENYLCIKF